MSGITAGYRQFGAGAVVIDLEKVSPPTRATASDRLVPMPMRLEG
jgi:hypothetical protein